jgi:ParB-like chromosome segregation protein Spo0J
MIDVAKLVIDDEFRSYIRTLTDDERSGLVESIRENGILEPIVVWLGHGIIVDGHNRYEIWKNELGADENSEPTVIEKKFDSRNSVKEFMIRKQFARRNLTDAERARYALLLKPVLAEKAKESQKRTKSGSKSVLVNLPKQNTREELAKQAGVSASNIAKVEKVLKEAPKQVQDDMLAGKVSINAAHKTVSKKPEPEPKQDKRTSFNPGDFDPEMKDESSKEVGPSQFAKKLELIETSVEAVFGSLGPLIRALDNENDQSSIPNYKSIVAHYQRFHKEFGEARTTLIQLSKSWKFRK